MNKISIYSAVRTKIIIRYVCALVVILICGAALTTNLLSSSKKAEAAVSYDVAIRACVFRGNATYSYSDINQTCGTSGRRINGMDILVAGPGTSVTLANSYHFGTVTVNNISQLTLGDSVTVYDNTNPTMIINNLNVNQPARNGATLITYRTIKVLGNVRVYSGGVVTHDALFAGVDFTSATGNPLTPSGQLKKVDLDIDGTLTLDSGGKIDVSGKGYPGGQGGVACDSSYKGEKGRGPGGGGYGYSTNDSANIGGGGGGYGGNGGAGFAYFNNIAGTAGVRYNNEDLSDTSLGDEGISFGSGGGTGCWSGGGAIGNQSGGSGGGRVRITASSIIIGSGTDVGIYANGRGGSRYFGNLAEQGGAGSGGSVLLNISSTIISGMAYNADAGKVHYTRLDSAVPWWGSGDDGRNGSLKNTGNLPPMTSLNGSNVQALGGDSSEIKGASVTGESPGGAGGGGRILIITPSSATVRKTLTAVSRNGVAAVAGTDFNPYALQKGDKIRVTLTVAASGGTYDLTDIFLTGGGTSCRCGGISGVACNATAPPAPVPDGTSIKWRNVPFATTPVLTYECTVR